MDWTRSRASGGGAARSGEEELGGVRRSGGRTEESRGGTGNNLGEMQNASGKAWRLLGLDGVAWGGVGGMQRTEE
eukprot:5434273-Pyramimonas_sp.AAC.1